jgi:hypothetical protein
VSDNTLVNSPLPSLTPVVLFPSLLYNLQFASNLYLSFLPELPKTGKGKASQAVLSDGKRNQTLYKNSRVLNMSPAVFIEGGVALRWVLAVAREQC